MNFSCGGASAARVFFGGYLCEVFFFHDGRGSGVF